MIKLGTQIGFSEGLNFTDEEIYRAMSEVGFHSVDFALMYGYQSSIWKLSDDELKKEMEKVRHVIHANGLFVGQTHSPIDADYGNDITSKEERWYAQIQAIKASSFLNAPYIVIHPIVRPYHSDRMEFETVKQQNMEYYSFLKPYLEEYNVKAAIENLFAFDFQLGRTCRTTCSTAEDIKDYIDSLHSDRFVACLDVGHAVLASCDPVDMIYKLGKEYLCVTHMHDNNYLNDDHMMPGIGKIDWHAIGKALNDIGFSGVFNYEADRTYYRLRDYRTNLSLKYLKVYAELGKAIINVNKK